MTSTATPGVHPSPDLLREVLRHVDDEHLLKPLFEEASTDLRRVAKEFGFDPQRDLFEVGAMFAEDAVTFSWTRSMFEGGVGRHFTITWAMRLPLESASFGTGTLDVTLRETGYDKPSVTALLLAVTEPWWTDMSYGWTPEHCQALVRHLYSAWSQVRAEDALAALQGAFRQLDAEMAP